MEIALRSMSSSSIVHLEYMGRFPPAEDVEEALRGGETDLAKRVELSETARFNGIAPSVEPFA